MKARLTTGEVVTLGKGCDCITHNIPHWVHEFRQSRDMSRKEFDGYVHRMRAIESSAAGGKVSLSVYFDHALLKLAANACAGDLSRLYGHHHAEFARRGIAELIAEEADELTELQQQRIRAHWASLIPVKPEPEPYANEASRVRIEAARTL